MDAKWYLKYLYLRPEELFHELIYAFLDRPQIKHQLLKLDVAIFADFLNYFSIITNHYIQIWSYGGACIRTLTGHQDAVTCLQFDSTRIVSGSMDCNLKIWDIHSGDCINTIDWKASEGHTGVVR